MDSAALLLAVVAVLVAGGALSFALKRARETSNALGAVSVALACIVGLGVSIDVLVHGPTGTGIAVPWRVPLAAFIVGVDRLSAFFLAPVFALGAVTAAYGGTAMRSYPERKNIGRAWFAFALLLAGMALLLLSRNGVLFLFAWEIMSLAAWFLVAFEHERDEARRAGWIYLVATHIGAAALFVLFLTLSAETHAVDFTAPLGADAPRNLLLALALVGFGAKAGLVPFHVWLPEAHAAAPSHVSAVLSGVMVKMGVYGILRLVLVLGGPPLWLGPFLMVVGLAGGFLGIVLSLSQRDLKRALAYSSIENVGIISLGIGLGFWGWSTGQHAVATIGLFGGLLHVWNHALMKGLLFLGAGNVLHATGTKDLEHLGGLMRSMPVTGALVTLGAVALAALPPLNGFVSEWILYRGLIAAGTSGQGATATAALLAIGVLALIGALTAASFARLVGTAFLGEPRTTAAAEAHESHFGELAPMVILGLGCAAIGLLPGVALHAVAPVVEDLLGTASALPFDMAPIGAGAAAVWSLVAVAAVTLTVVRRSRPAATSSTWGCGYLAPGPRMQYTARAFAQLGADTLAPGSLRPTIGFARIDAVLPASARLVADYGDPAYERVYLPYFRRWARRFAHLRRYQQGMTWLYVAYIAAALVAALAWTWLREVFV